MKIEAYYTFFVKLLGTAQEFKYSHWTLAKWKKVF